MKTTFSKSLRLLSMSCLALWLVAPRTVADEARFFRIVGPTATTITAFTPDGYITWTNALVGSNYLVQTARSLGAATNWVDYIQIPVSNNVITHRLYDPNPPSGMVLIPAGSFAMGATTNMGHEYYNGEVPQHTVYVSALYMDQYEVTKSLWDTVYQWATNHGYTFDRAGWGKASTHPINIDWYDAVKWCNARSEKERRVPAYYTSAEQTNVYRSGTNDLASGWVKWNEGYRLPTEAEWEKAARGGVAGHRFPWSDVETITHSQANYYVFAPDGTNFYPYDMNPTAGYHPTFTNGVAPYTSPVGYFRANGYGLYDMAGNMTEWCWDWYSIGYYSSSATSDPRGAASGSWRTVRGGGYSDWARFCRTADRTNYSPDQAFGYMGFRSVLPPSQ